ncbi:hypothetical protein HPB50_009066 [Hyalomma asiaticum]|uniref:Uncharacterized protein n=1 Tax=Hyalomma asiaticum TaxID=266040 RepID=A0ACB7SDQ5_HYAAI|nr:hypothetical protein HPB50_009066 [Hyalomma asiaticum]
MSTRVRAVRLVSTADEPRQQPPIPPTQDAEFVEVEVLPAEPCTSHQQSPSLPRLPSRFCFPKSSASHCSVTNIYCHVPETRQVAATGGGCRAPGTRLEWKLQPDGRLEVRVGPALTEEEEAKRTKAAKQASADQQNATAKAADVEEKKNGAPAPATPEAVASTSASGGSNTETKKPDKTWSFKLAPRAPVSFEVTLGVKKAAATRQPSAFSVRLVDVPATGPVLATKRPSLPAYVVRRRRSETDFVAEHEEPPPLQPCVECVEELARRLAESGGPCRINVVTRSASFNATENVVSAVLHDSGSPAGSELSQLDGD